MDSSIAINVHGRRRALERMVDADPLVRSADLTVRSSLDQNALALSAAR